ncbi:Putative OTU domain, papain-like cysteine peptidase superfamily [Septoria linicola]|uniref:OTU domain, papain-like cysteine peptidase superfamily n=1 Tax=Septoria linicola TaxID=215465 RepID=A0A9Q9ENY1_9PEZI|nr:putative OTU domain, papain-like cysteine peptidase superfamily [Septoria linicola]USW57107.1 Putative OTU domain, papain-like cysteine peptidase superfamily [Septoria linicola]
MTAEFPLLGSLGLYAADIRGDGNCLFNALSDQIYGHQNEHAAIRSRVIDYMREHADYYKQFIDVHPGGGIRRNPKRKNAGSYSSPASFEAPTPAEIDRVFENHLASMARGGTYGDNMEIVAFSSAMGYDVRIYQRDFAYVVSGNHEETGRPVAHIAYHTWEHYSSIRNLDGPHTGKPDVTVKVLSPEEEAKQKEELAKTSPVLPWMIDVVSKSLPYLADKITIKRHLEAAKGNIDMAVSNMLDAEENGSTSSQVESSSIERDHDSDDDTHDGPNKKQDRRMSRASRAHKERSRDSKHALSNLSVRDESQESFASFASEASSQPDSTQHSTSTQLTSNDDNDAASKSSNTSQQHDASSTQTAPAKPPVRIKLLPPRPPPGKTSQKQSGPRVSARDKKDMQKQAQKKARKERQQAESKSAKTDSPTVVGLQLRAKGMTETPPVDTLRTLYI